MVQDFESALEDLNKAISLRSDFALAYFTRANIRYKFIDYMRNSFLEIGPGTLDLKRDRQLSKKREKYDVEMVIKDLDKVNELMPDFAFSHYNELIYFAPNRILKLPSYIILKLLKLIKFCRILFQQSLTYLFIGEDALGLSDLSKAGELEIYQAQFDSKV